MILFCFSKCPQCYRVMRCTKRSDDSCGILLGMQNGLHNSINCIFTLQAPLVDNHVMDIKLHSSIQTNFPALVQPQCSPVIREETFLYIEKVSMTAQRTALCHMHPNGTAASTLGS